MIHSIVTSFRCVPETTFSSGFDIALLLGSQFSPKHYSKRAIMRINTINSEDGEIDSTPDSNWRFTTKTRHQQTTPLPQSNHLLCCSLPVTVISASGTGASTTQSSDHATVQESKNISRQQIRTMCKRF